MIPGLLRLRSSLLYPSTCFRQYWPNFSPSVDVPVVWEILDDGVHQFFGAAVVVTGALFPHTRYGTGEEAARKYALCDRVDQFSISCMNGCSADFSFVFQQVVDPWHKYVLVLLMSSLYSLTKVKTHIFKFDFTGFSGSSYHQS